MADVWISSKTVMSQKSGKMKMIGETFLKSLIENCLEMQKPEEYKLVEWIEKRDEKIEKFLEKFDDTEKRDVGYFLAGLLKKIPNGMEVMVEGRHLSERVKKNFEDKVLLLTRVGVVSS